MNNAIVIYSADDSERLRYVAQQIFTNWLGLPYSITNKEEEIKDLPFFISYGSVFSNALSIPAAGLLFENEILEQKIETGTWDNIPVLFAVDDSRYTLPFDIFSAIFFLISRYEEYYSFEADKYGRYPATESILYKNGWLERPIADEWLQKLRMVLHQYNVNMPVGDFTFVPTYDIDIAYSYRLKGFKRTAGAYLKDALSGNMQKISLRTKVLAGRIPDPYDAFDWMEQLHEKDRIRPLYFILSALQTTAFDKNLSPENYSIQQLIKRLAANGTIGLHPSYYSDIRPELWDKEKNTLEIISGQPIKISRQHYIKMQMPHTYERLIAKGIYNDYSMGYGSHLGFRAGTGASFLWYDLEKETATNLRIYPFCFMDTAAMYEMKLTTEEAFHKLDAMKSILEQTHSQLITIFHNFSLGTSEEWAGWKDAYETFILGIGKR